MAFDSLFINSAYNSSYILGQRWESSFELDRKRDNALLQSRPGILEVDPPRKYRYANLIFVEANMKRRTKLASTLEVVGFIVVFTQALALCSDDSLEQIFNSNSPLTVQGMNVAPAGNRFFDGNGYCLDGGPYLGISVINTSQQFEDPIAEPMTEELLQAHFAWNTIGGDVGPPSIRNITGFVQEGLTWDGTSNPNLVNLLDADYVGELIFNSAPDSADQVLTGDQGCNAIQGTQTDPKFVYVCGNVSCASTDVSGAGLLVVSGNLLLSGTMTFNGVVLAIGSGSLDLRGMPTINGRTWVANLECDPGGYVTWEAVRIARLALHNLRFVDYLATDKKKVGPLIRDKPLA